MVILFLITAELLMKKLGHSNYVKGCIGVEEKSKIHLK
jgi:hypothetical protein